MPEFVYRISYTFSWYPVCIDLMYNREGYPLKNYGLQLGWFRKEIEITNAMFTGVIEMSMQRFIEIVDRKYCFST